jgi:hypothetical protein
MSNGIANAFKAMEADLPAYLQHQPEPQREVSKPNIWDLVMDDMRQRNEFGCRKYGGPLQPNDGRDNLADVYQELLDACAYMRKLIYERDGN